MKTTTTIDIEAIMATAAQARLAGGQPSNEPQAAAWTGDEHDAMFGRLVEAAKSGVLTISIDVDEHMTDDDLRLEIGYGLLTAAVRQIEPTLHGTDRTLAWMYA